MFSHLDRQIIAIVERTPEYACLDDETLRVRLAEGEFPPHLIAAILDARMGARNLDTEKEEEEDK